MIEKDVTDEEKKMFVTADWKRKCAGSMNRWHRIVETKIYNR